MSDGDVKSVVEGLSPPIVGEIGFQFLWSHLEQLHSLQ